jgi:hypothetical protein
MPETPSRRNFLRAVSAAAAYLALKPLAGCSRRYYSREPEAVIFNDANRRDLSAQELGLVRGQTKILDAEFAMERRGLTHIAKDTNITGDTRIEIITADYQHSVHVFVNGKYEASLDLGIEVGEYPHRYALRVANIPGDGFMVMALIRDAVGIEPTRLAMVPYSGGEFGEPHTEDLTGMERGNGGLERPLFVGYDLGEGITFIARDGNGDPWENGYIIGWENGRMTKRAVPFAELMQCSCVSDWAASEGEE